MGFEILWTADKEKEFDPFNFARELLKDAIENLKKDGSLASAVFVATEETLHCLEISFDGQDDKQATYREVIDFAKENAAKVIITLNDAYWGPPGSAEGYYPRKLKEEYGTECIFITVSGPGLKNWTIEARYRTEKNDLLFEPPTEESGAQIGMLDGWADETESVN